MSEQIDQAQGSSRGEACQSIAGWFPTLRLELWLLRMATSTNCKSRSSVEQTGIAVPFARGGRDPQVDTNLPVPGCGDLRLAGVSSRPPCVQTDTPPRWTDSRTSVHSAASVCVLEIVDEKHRIQRPGRQAWPLAFFAKAGTPEFSLQRPEPVSFISVGI